MINSETESTPDTFWPTAYGAAAVGLWSIGALFVCWLERIPTLEIMSLVLMTGGWISLKLQGISISPQRCLNRLKNGWIFLVLLAINELGYTYAFRLAPAAQIDLIYYTWPIMMVAGRSFTSSYSLRSVHYLGLILAFMGIVVLVAPILFEDTFSWKFLLGYGVAIAAGLGWVVYSLFDKSAAKKRYGYSSVGEDVLIIGIAGVILNTLFGEWVAPELVEVEMMLLLAVCIFGLAFPMWLKGVAKGNTTLVGGMANAIPILSVMWLAAGGVAEMTSEVLTASLLVTAGCFCLAAQTHP